MSASPAGAAGPASIPSGAAGASGAHKGLYTLEDDGRGGQRLKLHLHAGQAKAWNATQRFVWMLAGSQGGKTSFGPLWLWRECRRCGPGDYIAVTATYPLLQLKMLPEFLRLFQHTLHLGEWHALTKTFVFDGQRAAAHFGDPAWRDTPSRVIFGSGINPEGLESATAKAAWLDECGQEDFKLQSYEAILRRLSIHQGRILGGTTIYNLGWLKTHAYDPWRAGDPDHAIISFPSILNPVFPKAEYERAKRTMATWKFDMFYRGEFSRPAGLIYQDYRDEYAPDGNKVRPFAIPHGWPCHVGIDFGAVNLALVWLAKNPETGHLYVYRERHGGTLSTPEHARLAKRVSAHERIMSWHGGNKSEKQQRLDWQAAGVPIKEPENYDVLSGIDAVTDVLRSKRLFVFDSCAGLRDEFGSYQWEVDDEGEATEKIKHKEQYHHLDALRYVLLGIKGRRVRTVLAQGRVAGGWGMQHAGSAAAHTAPRPGESRWPYAPH